MILYLDSLPLTLFNNLNYNNFKYISEFTFFKRPQAKPVDNTAFRKIPYYDASITGGIDSRVMFRASEIF